MGGLGNQLFQIFCGVSYSLRHGVEFRLPDSKSLDFGSRNRHTYWKSFFRRLEQHTVSDISSQNIYREPKFAYIQIPDSYKEKEFQILGFFQSYKYFEDKYNEICQLIDIDRYRDEVKEKYRNYYEKETISIHFRLDDYFQLTDYHPIPTINHYIKSLEYIINKTNKDDYRVLYFCQSVDNDYVKERIKEIEERLPKLEFVKVTDEAEDWEQMLIMSHCNHNITANSSFSWWGSYMNENSKKIVCYPAIWFGETAKADTKDLCPDTWVKVIS